MSLNLVGLRFASETGEVWWSPSNITIPHTRVVVLPSAGSTFQRLIECVFWESTDANQWDIDRD